MNRHAIIILFAGLLSAAHAQIEVGLDIKRTTFIRGEPIEAAVIIRNLAGKDIMLTDSEGDRWFGFQITKGEDNPIGPFSGEYKNPPQVLLNGGTMRRSVDLLRLYPVNEYGSYTVRAAIYFHETGKYITSPAVKIEVSEGRKLWSQTMTLAMVKSLRATAISATFASFPVWRSRA